ncbi:ferredoxin [Thermogladius sp. 4427co]|uniref:ferredoxin n=1 Tax=Thermogladius sp. 4427co TaxID=3450718 RepID=UPI003F7A2E6E
MPAGSLLGGFLVLCLNPAYSGRSIRWLVINVSAPAACPEVFELGIDNGKNKVVDKYAVESDGRISVGIIPGELYECARLGAEVCPVGAIRIEALEG